MNGRRRFVSVIAACALLAAGTAPGHAQAARYQVHKVVSNIPGLADHLDPNLVNPWGIAFNPQAFVWVADNGTGVSTLYDGQGVANSLVVAIPGVAGGNGTPTGIVFNGSNDFMVSNGAHSGPSRFIFATEDGLIAGWSPGVDFTHALVAVPPTGAVYKGLAIAANGQANFLYAADLLNGKIDVFDANFAPVPMPGAFHDPRLPANFSPFNITNIQGNLYVSYAEHFGTDHDETGGPGLGVVDVFDPNGNLIRRLTAGGTLNAPWGMVLAPGGFGKFSHRLLVGNFGDGTINAFNIKNGKFKGQLRGMDGKPLVIDGLWGLAFGNGHLNQPTNVLFFAAGLNDEQDGLYGSISAAPQPGEDEEDDGD